MTSTPQQFPVRYGHSAYPPTRAADPDDADVKSQIANNLAISEPWGKSQGVYIISPYDHRPATEPTIDVRQQRRYMQSEKNLNRVIDLVKIGIATTGTLKTRLDGYLLYYPKGFTLFGIIEVPTTWNRGGDFDTPEKGDPDYQPDNTKPRNPARSLERLLHFALKQKGRNASWTHSHGEEWFLMTISEINTMLDEIYTTFGGDDPHSLRVYKYTENRGYCYGFLNKSAREKIIRADDQYLLNTFDLRNVGTIKHRNMIDRFATSRIGQIQRSPGYPVKTLFDQSPQQDSQSPYGPPSAGPSSGPPSAAGPWPPSSWSSYGTPRSQPFQPQGRPQFAGPEGQPQFAGARGQTWPEGQPQFAGAQGQPQSSGAYGQPQFAGSQGQSLSVGPQVQSSLSESPSESPETKRSRPNTYMRE